MEWIDIDVVKGTIKYNMEEIIDIASTLPEGSVDVADMRSICEKIEEIERILFFIKGKKEYEAKKFKEEDLK